MARVEPRSSDGADRTRCTELLTELLLQDPRSMMDVEPPRWLCDASSVFITSGSCPAARLEALRAVARAAVDDLLTGGLAAAALRSRLEAQVAPVDPPAAHRRLDQVTPWLLLSGDLHPDRETALVQLRAWQEAGVTDVIDVRQEWCDEAFVAHEAPGVRYWHVPTHDDGRPQPVGWFDDGLSAAAAAMAEPGATMLVHCHLGVNRGPSLALRVLLAQGYELLDALDAIRAARPVAAIAYADDAVAHHHHRLGSDEATLGADLARVRGWRIANRVDAARIIRGMRPTRAPRRSPSPLA